MNMKNWKLAAAALGGLVIGGLSGAVFAKAGDKPAYVLDTPDALKWNPIDPKMPKGAQAAIVSGDPMTGPVAFELKLPKGPSPIHYHTSDYYAVIVAGSTKHWLATEDGTKAKANPVGTAWFQPGGSDKSAHGDECVTDSCTLFIMMPGKLDLIPVPPAKK
jgi:hypothetical protein